MVKGKPKAKQTEDKPPMTRELLEKTISARADEFLNSIHSDPSFNQANKAQLDAVFQTYKNARTNRLKEIDKDVTEVHDQIEQLVVNVQPAQKSLDKAMKETLDFNRTEGATLQRRGTTYIAQRTQGMLTPDQQKAFTDSLEKDRQDENAHFDHVTKATSNALGNRWKEYTIELHQQRGIEDRQHGIIDTLKRKKKREYIDHYLVEADRTKPPVGGVSFILGNQYHRKALDREFKDLPELDKSWAPTYSTSLLARMVYDPYDLARSAINIQENTATGSVRVTYNRVFTAFGARTKILDTLKTGIDNIWAKKQLPGGLQRLDLSGVDDAFMYQKLYVYAIKIGYKENEIIGRPATLGIFGRISKKMVDDAKKEHDTWIANGYAIQDQTFNAASRAQAAVQQQAPQQGGGAQLGLRSGSTMFSEDGFETEEEEMHILEASKGTSKKAGNGTSPPRGELLKVAEKRGKKKEEMLKAKELGKEKKEEKKAGDDGKEERSPFSFGRGRGDDGGSD